jgi:hypothetical protein
LAESTASTPRNRLSRLALRKSVRVELWVHPAHTGTRPAAASATMQTAISHSSSSRVAASPVDPQATRKSTPESICQFTNARSAVSSIDPSARKGVTIAVPQPVVSITEKCITNRG